MIGLAAGTRIWIVAGVTDMRRGFVGLSGMVQTALQENPFLCGGPRHVARMQREGATHQAIEMFETARYATYD